MSETYDSNEGDVRITSETQRFIEVFVNGRSQGKQPLNGSPSIKEVATELAQQHGIRTFTVSVDDAVVTNDMAHQAAVEGSRFSVQAKDSRGAGKNAKQTAATPAPTPAPDSAEEEYEEVTEPPADNPDAEEEKAS